MLSAETYLTSMEEAIFSIVHGQSLKTEALEIRKITDFDIRGE